MTEKLSGNSKLKSKGKDGLDFPKNPTPPTQEDLYAVLNAVKFFEQGDLFSTRDMSIQVQSEVFGAARTYYPSAVASEKRRIKRREFLVNSIITTGIAVV